MYVTDGALSFFLWTCLFLQEPMHGSPCPRVLRENPHLPSVNACAARSPHLQLRRSFRLLLRSGARAIRCRCAVPTLPASPPRDSPLTSQSGRTWLLAPVE